VFPDYIFTQIPEARHLPGTISIDGDLMVKLLDNVCREIARNGCKKVVLINAHGGNFGLLAYYNMLQLYKPKDYVVYIVNPIGAAMRGEVQLPWDRSVDGHAGPGETSMMLSIRPDLVHMDRIVAGEGQSLQRLDALREAGVQTGIWWYADYPTHYAGDATYATAAAGEQILDATAAAVVQAVRAIKADDVAKRLQDDFYTGSQAPRLPGQ
jgi:creatinine amidohydrolase